MKIRKLRNENIQFLDNHKCHGFGSKTEMINCALDLLRERLKKEQRRKEREEMLNQYAASLSGNYFSNLDGDDFE